MIVKRKTYSRRDPMPEPFTIPNEWDGKWETIEYAVRQVDKKYNDEIKQFGPLEKQKIKKLREDLKNGYVYQDGPAGGDTHYLEDYSKPEKYHKLTKTINTSDRLEYSVYPPTLDEKNKKLVVPIVIQSLKGHTIYGQGTYTERDID